MTTATNFETVAAELIACAPTEKGAAFAARLADQIRAKGAEWIEARQTLLGVHFGADGQRASFPVADNRLYFLTRWQEALMA